MFIHWGLYAIPARGEWVRNAESLSNDDYQPYFDEFNPRLYDAREWARIAKQAGQKYVVLTAKHHDGFCLFDSKLTDYKSTNTPIKRDLIREYVDAFRAEGLKVGFYYSLLDWHHPHYPVAGDARHPMRNNPKVAAEKRDLSIYIDYLHGQVRELLTNYGKIDVIWFDFSYDKMAGSTWRAKELVAMAHSLQPHIIMDNRLSSETEHYGDFFSPEQIIPAEGVVDKEGKPCVWEACITLNDHWGYCRDDHNFKSPAQVIRMLVECISKGGNLLLNVGPNALGVIQPEATERLETIGQWLAANDESVYGCGKANLPKPEWGYYTTNGKKLFAHIMQKPVGPIGLIGLGGKVRKARLLMDGSEVNIGRPWNVEKDSKDCFMTIPPMQLPDELDTVVALELA
jgi:alpha-L-fucosidase